MKVKKNLSYLFISLDPNENLLKSLISICEKYRIQTGIIISGIGQLKQVTLGYFKEKNNYTPEFYKDTYELLSLSGTIIRNNKTYIPHLHAILGKFDKKTLGGHLLDASVEVTNEIIAIPKTIPNIDTILPSSVTGEISPYPTVEMVTNAQ